MKKIFSKVYFYTRDTLSSIHGWLVSIRAGVEEEEELLRQLTSPDCMLPLSTLPPRQRVLQIKLTNTWSEFGKGPARPVVVQRANGCMLTKPLLETSRKKFKFNLVAIKFSYNLLVGRIIHFPVHGCRKGIHPRQG